MSKKQATTADVRNMLSRCSGTKLFYCFPDIAMRGIAITEIAHRFDLLDHLAYLSDMLGIIAPE
ncbi:hypothetical protein ACIBCD_20085 [Nocardia brasiliensis]|uniref:hypothetical protein n=1 Tax=Nocardia brasiliensis TaxID=37326 RepID=UPI00379E4CAE